MADTFSVGLGTEQLRHQQQTGVTETHKIAFGDMSPTFTGSDITALIIRQDDPLMIKRAAEYLERLSDDVSNAAAIAKSGNANGLGTDNPFVPTDEMYDVSQQPVYPVINLQAVTISTFRNKQQVRALGHVNPKGVARGTRTIGGTLILTEFDRDPFWKMITDSPVPVPGKDINVGDSGNPVLPDQLLEFNLMLLFANEAGILSYRMIYGIELVTNGTVYSIQDMYNENTLSFLCTDVTPLTPLPPLITRDNALMSEMLKVGTGKAIRISPLASITSGKEVLRRFRLLKNSRNNQL